MSIPSGFLLINKPSGLPREASPCRSVAACEGRAKWGPTSHDVIDELRRITGERRIGHAGTLDPFASGLLIVAVGRDATRQISQFSKMDKTYVAKLHLGATSDTQDRTGKLLITNYELLITEENVKKTLKNFVGEQEQIPPMYSAKKIEGEKLYELARKGIEIERRPAEINIHYIKLLNVIPDAERQRGKYSGIQKNSMDPRLRGNDTREDNAPYLIIETRVSSGTYIRTLAHDIGQALGCGAYLEKLQRTTIGDYKLEDAVETKNLTQGNWTNFLFNPNINNTGIGEGQ